ncbi:hypothetical protein DBR06_SOUSAS27010040, partial [Sousa chinensis]
DDGHGGGVRTRAADPNAALWRSPASSAPAGPGRSGTMDSFKVVLEGPAPWGFRLQGGKDFNVPLSISRLTPGGKAAQAGVAVGDWVLSIDGENAGGLTHIEAQNKIRACGERLSLGLSRYVPAPARPARSVSAQALAPAADPPRYTFAPSASLNKTARPFGAPQPADSAPQQNGYVHPARPHPSCPPTAHAICPQPHARPLPAAAQSALCPSPAGTVRQRPLAARAGTAGTGPHRGCGSCLGTVLLEALNEAAPPRWWPGPHPPHRQPLRPLVPDASKQRLMEDTEDWRPRPGTGQSRSFRILAHLTGTEFMQDPDEEHLKKSREKYVLELQSPRYTRLRDWHHQRSAHVLNVQS